MHPDIVQHIATYLNPKDLGNFVACHPSIYNLFNDEAFLKHFACSYFKKQKGYYLYSQITKKEGSGFFFFKLFFFNLLGNNISIDKLSVYSHRSMLCEATQYRRYDICKFLINHNAYVNSRDWGNYQALHTAAYEGCLDICKLLIKNDADINVRTKDNNTPLLLAAERIYYKICKLLLDNGAMVNEKNGFGESPIHWASFACDYKLMKLFIDYGGDVDATDIVGRRPIFIVSSSRNLDFEIMKLLIKSGADTRYSRKDALLKIAREGHTLKEVVLSRQKALKRKKKRKR